MWLKQNKHFLALLQPIDLTGSVRFFASFSKLGLLLVKIVTWIRRPTCTLKKKLQHIVSVGEREKDEGGSEALFLLLFIPARSNFYYYPLLRNLHVVYKNIRDRIFIDLDGNVEKFWLSCSMSYAFGRLASISAFVPQLIHSLTVLFYCFYLPVLSYGCDQTPTTFNRSLDLPFRTIKQ